VFSRGELCQSPMGLSLVTKLSPKRLVGIMMGGWFCATAFGVAMILRLVLPRLEKTMQEYGA